MLSRIRLPSLPLAFWILAAGWLAMYLPTYQWLARTIWASDEQGHGPIILLVCAFLLFQRRKELAEIDSSSRTWAIVTLMMGCALYILGRSQSIYILDVGSQLLVLSGLLLLFTGVSGLKLCAFPVLFLVFMIPLPSGLVAAVTAPLKAAVSSAASSVLYSAGFPVARSGVMLSIGQYQLLVADACAGLNSMFTLEALGLLYMNAMRYKSIPRNVWLAVSVIPISFCANVARVIILILITYFFGDEAGQGFAHEFAGIVLFLFALVLILAVDGVIGLAIRRQQSRIEIVPQS